MRVFKTRYFAKWAKKEGVSDEVLAKSVREIAQGLVEANLGGNVFKKRLPIPGQGKRGGARSIIALTLNERAFFIYGYSKNEKANIDSTNLKAAKELAKELLKYDGKVLSKLIQSGVLFEVRYDG